MRSWWGEENMVRDKEIQEYILSRDIWAYAHKESLSYEQALHDLAIELKVNYFAFYDQHSISIKDIIEQNWYIEALNTLNSLMKQTQK